ncbi:MAG: family N-acetyltransferase [Paenibacillaceae bacterium]|nr:family N-acetyltransferase [Paenibacillaceae bacterium]
MIDIRFIEEKDLKDAIIHADLTFRREGQKSMMESFPKIFSPALGQSMGLFVDGELASFNGLVPSVVWVGGARLGAYSLGAVYTRPEYRGQGYATQLMQAVKTHIRRTGASLLFVSGARTLYTREGCGKFGASAKFAIHADNEGALGEASSAAVSDLAIREWQPADLLGIHRLAQQRPVRFEQSAWDLADLLYSGAWASLTNQRHVVLVAERAGKFAAWCTFGVPGELKPRNVPMAIEWAGEARDVLALMLHARKTYLLQELVVNVPWHERELGEQLSPIESKPEKNTGTLCIADAEQLASDLQPYFQQRDPELADSLAIRTLAEHRHEVMIGGKLSRRLTPHELVTLMFDPEPELDLEPEFAALAARLLPVPLPYAKALNFT